MLSLNKPNYFLAFAVRAALVMVCLSVSLGNSLVAQLLNRQVGLVVESMPTEEAPAEELPVETESPCELVELDGFTRQRVCQLQRRPASVAFHHFLSVVRGSSCAAQSAQHRSKAGELYRRNGCGATLRC